MRRKRAANKHNQTGGGGGGGGVGRLRVQAGAWRGRTIQTLPDRRVRPMLDRIREALFNSLQARSWIDGAFVLDVFAGTGILGLEALSRGAAHATFFERDAEVFERLKQSAQQLEVEPTRIRLLHGDALQEGPRLITRFLGAPLDKPPPPLLIFLDPPYAELREPRAEAFLAELATLIAHVAPSQEVSPRPPVLLIIGHETSAPVPNSLAGWPQRETRRYGRACLSYYGDWPEP